MTERTFTHTFDMDLLVQVAVEYEKTIRKGSEVIDALNPFDPADSTALELAGLASDALGATHAMFMGVLPREVFSEFQDLLEEAMQTADV